MRIAIIAPLLIKIPPQNFGFGAQEYIIHEITEGLVRKGHDVTLFASGDSKTEAKLVSVLDVAISSKKDMRPFEKETMELLELYEASSGKFDVINNHILPYGLLFERLFKSPVAHTLHHEIHKERVDSVLYGQHLNSNYISISDAQRKTMPQLNYIDTIYNAVDTSSFAFEPAPQGDFYFYLGRMKRYKGIHIAIDICRKNGLKMKIASPMPVKGQNDYDEVMKYWEEDLKPRIGGDIEYLGEVSGEEKLKLLSNTKALIFPVLREEPFGMTIIEAMSCGAPVIAFNRGAVGEIMQGFENLIVNDENEMEAAILELNNLDAESYSSLRKQVRKTVEEKFSVNTMIDNYERVLERLVNSTKK